MTDLRQALAQEQTKCPRCGEVNPAEIHTCSPQVAQPEQDKLLVDLIQEQRAEIDRLRHALAQPEQEPVAYIDHVSGKPKLIDGYVVQTDYDIPLYIAQPEREWVGLTGEEVDAIRKDIFEKYKNALVVTRDVTNENNYSAFNFYRAIEEKLRIKND